MDERNAQRRERKRWTRKSRLYRTFASLLFSACCIAICILFLTGGGGSDKNLPANPGEAQTTVDIPSETAKDDDFQSSSTDSDWNLVLVNKWNPIPENYAGNLVEAPGGEKVDARIYAPLMEMLEAAKEDNWDQLPMIVSGYRTQEKQQKLYDEKIAEYKGQGYSEDEAIEQAEQWVAVPGYSEHQLGIAVDINGATYDLYFWLQENSYKYGFIFRYPGGKTDITGVAEEVWHYRYVGVEAATEMYEQGLCLEEYLEKSAPGGPNSGQTPAEPPAPEESAYDYNAPVPENTPVDDLWFDDAVFIGNSRMEGFQLFSGLTDGVFYTKQGLMVDTAMTDAFVDVNGQKFTIPEALSADAAFSKVYIMLGLNELGWSYSQVYKLKYGELIDAILAANPQADVYIQSILPVSAEKSAEDPIYNNTRIGEFNTLLRELAAEKQVYYVDAAAAVADESGCLPADGSWDGVHLKPELCAAWLAYLKCHTV